jgi:hypothetical protein
MKQERKIKPVVRKFSSFQDAEEADDEYWANTTPEERLNALIDLRKIFINSSGNKFQMVVNRRSIYEGIE